MAIFISSVQHFFGKYFRREEIEEERATKIEAYLSIIFNILIWDDPFISGVVFSLAHVVFWIILYFELRFFGVLFLLLLMLFLIDASFDSKQTNKSIPLKNIRELIKLSNGFFQYLTILRRDQPGTFCVCMCTGFFILSIIGRTLSGLFLTYFGLITLLLAPGIIYRLPPEVNEKIRHYFHIISTDEGVVDELELFPNVQEVGEEKDCDCDSMKTDHTADSSYTNSLVSGVTSMPSYLDAEGSMDGLEEEDLEFSRNSLTAIPSTYTTDSSDNEHKDIKFESYHFNRDSSSSDEEHMYEQGLSISELDAPEEKTTKPTTTFTQEISANLLSNLGVMGSTIVSTVIKTAATTSTKLTPSKRNDSDSDFEIIDTEDIQIDET